ncbi:ABC transporter permease [Pyxidicoccus xibeiensis]|uniref:ABC transporter permease n=1 Tax=Pyxidicoccus xibeiensis TaxID=2906759 RepID=UPI0020A7B5D5|nr:ABC transporter permease [Pyxidicoccus xibeiensis]MCP3144575.1 ABC transporter permease [Pyxidicoccus xibeiensis]
MFGRRSQEDFDAEVRAHLELETERLRAQGLSPAEAERVARRNFGNVAAAGDRFRDVQPFAWAEGFGRDLRHAWRALLRTPGFLITTVSTLALAIGAVAGMFSVVNAVLVQPLPFPEPERLVALTGTAPGSDQPERFDLGADFYLQYKEHSKLLDGITQLDSGTATLRVDTRVERVRMAWPTYDLYSTLGVRPQLGRLPVPEDGEGVVVISDQLWTSWFGRDPSVIGRSYFVSDDMKQVVGVMPPEFRFPNDETVLWIANPMRLEQVRPGQLGALTVARMKPGVTLEQLDQELTALSKELPARFGGPPSYARLIESHRAVAVPLLDRMVGSTARTSLWLLLGAVSLALLIACANVTNLFLVRAEGRVSDLAVRRALGAAPAQLVRSQLAEALLVAVPAGLLAICLSAVTLPLFVAAAPQGLPRLGAAGLDLATVATTFGLVLLCALVCGAAPALRAASANLHSMRDGGRAATAQRHGFRNGLVIGQTALALVLLIGAALLLQSFNRLRNVDPGYDTDGLYTFQFAPEQPHLTDGPSWGRMHAAFMERLRTMPGVTAVGVVNNIPLDEATSTARFRTDTMAEDDSGTLLARNFTGGDYFRAMGIDLLQGRAFTSDEAFTPNSNVVVSWSAAQQLWPRESPLGQSLRHVLGDNTVLPFTVVGVVEDVKQDDWREAGEAVVYFPLTGPTPTSWRLSSPAYVIKSPRADSLQGEVREHVRQVAPEAPVYREYTMEFLARRSTVELSFTMLTFAVVSGLTLLLAAVGLYGVLSSVVSARTREIGVRMALGATPGAVRRQVVSQGTRVVVIGVAIGVAAAFASTRYLGALLYEVKATEPALFLLTSGFMVVLGVLASYMPARRASSVDPVVSLRSE